MSDVFDSHIAGWLWVMFLTRTMLFLKIISYLQIDFWTIEGHSGPRVSDVFGPNICEVIFFNKKSKTKKLKKEKEI